jgi:hypothetical protein
VDNDGCGLHSQELFMRAKKILCLTGFIVLVVSLSSCAYMKKIIKPQPVPTVKPAAPYVPKNTGEAIDMKRLANDLHKKNGYVDNINFYNIYFNQFKALRQLLGHEDNHVLLLNLSGNFSSSVDDTFEQYFSQYSYFIQVLGDEKNQIIDLNLDNNNLNNQSAFILSRMLMHANNRITVLRLSNNLIGNEGVLALAQAFENPHCKLKWIDLSQNTFNDRARDRLETVAKKHNIKVVIS